MIPRNWARRVFRLLMRRVTVIGAVLVTALAAAATPAPSVHAQTIVGHVLDMESGGPVEGSLVLLLDAAGTESGGTLTGEDGRFLIRAPGSGDYALRAERIGYETTVSDFFPLAAGQTFQITLRVPMKALEIEGLRVEGERRCVVRPGEGLVLSALWEEAGKALRNQNWAEQQGLVHFEVTRYERELDPGMGLVLGELRDPPQWVTGNPIRSLPTDELVDGGFIRTEADGYRYLAPDAGVLLSDRFLDTHCFLLEDGPAPAGMVGLSFEPAGGGPAREIAGTLWLDREDASPRFLEFHYTSSPWPEAQGVAEGRVEFEELPGGLWIVRRWWIRMPKMIRDESLMVRGRSGMRVGSILEAGGEVARVTDHRLAGVPAEPRKGGIVGTVWDSIGGGPLAGAEVYLSGTTHSTFADSSGSFRFEGVPMGTYHLAFRHPRLDALGAYPRAREIQVVDGQVSRIELAGPAVNSVLAALCSGSGSPGGASAAVGTVRDRMGGTPVAGATVRLEWTDYRTQGGREIRADVQTVEVMSDTRGRFRVCGIPPGVVLAARATQGVTKGGIVRREVGRGDLAVLELTLESDLQPEPEPMEEACPGLDPDATVGGIQGQVRDAGTSVPIGKTTVWLVPEGGGPSGSTVSDAGGRFAFCGLAPGPYLLRTALRGVGEGTARLSLRPGQMAAADLDILFRSETERTGAVRGRVVVEDGSPLPGAEVRIGGELVRVTGPDGGFSFPDVPAGSAPLRVSFLGYGDAEGEVVVGGGQTVTVEIRLSPRPIELEPIVVEAVRFSTGGILADVQRRANSAWGTVVLGEDLAQRQARASRTTDILQNFGATVVGNGSAIFLHRTQCAPHVYLDGVKVTRIPRSTSGTSARESSEGPQTEAARALNMVHPADIAAIEIYRGPAEIPGEFLDSDARCGIILVWTKRGGSDPGGS